MARPKPLKPINIIQPSYRYLIITFTILAFILIGFILYFALSQATIYITPNFRTQQVGFALQVVNKNAVKTNEDLSEKLIGEILETATEQTKTYQAESYEVTETKASGEVTIINNYNRNQPLIATTRLLTPDGKLYRLAETVTVPAGGKVIALAQADKEGDEFEIGQTKMTIPGLWEGLRDKIYAETEGFKKQTLTKYTISQKTIDIAKADLKSILLTKAQEDLNAQLAKGQVIPESALVTETLKYSADAKVGSSEKEFSITLGIGVKGVVFDETRLKEIASNNLPDIYKANNTLVEIDSNSFSYDITLLDENSENLIAQIKGDYTIKVANIQITPGELTKMSKKEALTYLENFSDIKEASILLPFWTKHLPALSDKINIQIK